MMKTLFLSMFLMSGVLLSCQGGREGSVAVVSVEEFAALIESGGEVQLVDVRTPEEYAEGHVKGARLIDFKQDGFVEKANGALDKKKPVAVYCRSGRRSNSAATLLVQEGFRQVIDMDGGIVAWKEKGLPTEEGAQ